jgi:hypothetical protein
LEKLATIMPKVDPELVQSRLYGRKNFWILQKKPKSTSKSP